MSFLRWCALSFVMVFFLAATPLKAEPLFGYPDGKGDAIKLENIVRLLGAAQTLKDLEESETFVLRTTEGFDEFVQPFSLKKADNPGVDECLRAVFKAVFQEIEKDDNESEETLEDAFFGLSHTHIKNILKRCDDLKVTAEEDCLSCILEVMGHSIRFTLNAVSEKQPFDFAAEAQIIGQSFDDLISGHALYEESMSCIVSVFEGITANIDRRDRNETKDEAETILANLNLRISQSSGDIQFYRDQFASASEKFSEETLKSVMTPEEWATFLYSILINKELSEVLEEYLVTKLEMLSGVEFEEESEEEVSFNISSDSEGA